MYLHNDNEAKLKKSKAMGIGGAKERECCKSFLLIHQTSKDERTAIVNLGSNLRNRDSY